jgi:hypothetical protein
MDGLTVDGLAEISAQTNGDYALRVGDAAGSSGSVQGIGKIGINSQGAGVFTYTGTEIRATELGTSGYRAGLSFHTRGTNSDVEPLKRLDIAYNGDISFYDDTGTSQSLYWDASTERLGIGTTSPSATLDLVSSGTNSQSLLDLNSASGIRAKVATDAQDDAYMYLYDSADALKVAFRTDGNNSYIAGGGNVGIGTSSPNASLSISKQTTVLSGTGNTYGLHLYPTSSGAVYVDALTGSTSNTDLKLRSSGGTVTTFQTGGSERMRLTSTGLGIGTTSPASALDVSAASGADSVLSLTSTGIQRHQIIQKGTGDGSLTFYNQTAAAERMRITSGGLVGIGTTSPASLVAGGSSPVLSIGGTDTILTTGEKAGSLSFISADTSFTPTYADGIASEVVCVSETAVGGAYGLAFYTATTTGSNRGERLRINSLGNVGIGTTSPASTLEISKNDQTNGATLSITNSFDGGSWTAGDTIGTVDFRVDDGSATEKIRGQIKVFDDTSGSTTYPAYSAMSFSTGYFNALSERLRIDSLGRVGIGTTSPLARFDVESGTGNAGFNYGTLSSPDRGNLWYDTDGTGWRFNIGKVQAGSFTSQITIQDNGNVGIGTSSPSELLALQSSSGNAQIRMQPSATGTSGMINTTSGSTKGMVQYNHSSDYMRIYTNGSEKVRITSAGAFLVGKTADNTTDTGSVVGDGYIYATRSGNIPLVLNRTTSDGTIASFRKDGTTVGSIGVQAGNNITIGGSQARHAGLNFAEDGSRGVISPMEAGSLIDDSVDLGSPTYRFDDLHATNGTIQTSDRNEKQDIAELTDAETRVAVAAKGLLRKFKWQSAVTEKGDEARIHFGIIAQDLQDAFTAEGLDASDYGMFISSTWTDEETGEEKTRLGVRYSELLAFIIAAL